VWKPGPLFPTTIPPLVHSPPDYLATPPRRSFVGHPLPTIPSHLPPSTSRSVGSSVFATAPPPGILRCPISGCGQSRIATDCQRKYCRKHCIANGGCSSKTHTGTHSATQPSVSASQRSVSTPQRQLAAFRIPSPPRWLSPEPSQTPLSLAADTSPFISAPAPSHNLVNPAPAPLSLPDIESLDARPNARFRSHMPPIFTEQWKEEQELWAEQRRTESQQKTHATLVQHTVTVYAWVEDATPPTIQDFQGSVSFTWPYFPLSSSILSTVSLVGPDVQVQLYRNALGTWVNICPGHVVNVTEDTRLFLKAKHVINYVDFEELLNPESTSRPHLRHNLAEERRELRQRYQNMAKRQKGKARKATGYGSSDDEGSLNITTPTPSRRHFRRPSGQPSIFEASGSLLTTSVLEISSDDYSSPIPQHVPKRQKLNSPHALAPTQHHPSLSIHSMASDVIELSDSPDLSPRPLRRAVIKAEALIETSCRSMVPLQWPADFYTTDIVAFFAACADHSDVKLETIFHHHFPSTLFRRSTVNENRRRWKKAPQHVRDSMLMAKYTEDGKWSVFQRKSRINM
jgi:hypothetical protein